MPISRRRAHGMVLETLAMRMTPLDIQSHRFRPAWKGLNTEEVESFLQAVAEDYEALLREAETRSDQSRRLELRVDELSLNESLLKETLISAQSLGDELRHTATKQAEITVGEAEIKAEKVLDASHRRASLLSEEIRELRGLRTRMAAALRSTIATHGALVDSLYESPSADYVLDGELIEPPPNEQTEALSAAAATPTKRCSPGRGADIRANRQPGPTDA